jgi:hypothetical protein
LVLFHQSRYSKWTLNRRRMGGVAEGGGQKRLADPDGARDQRVVAGFDVMQRHQLGQIGRS